MKLAVVDLEYGNIGSIAYALERLGVRLGPGTAPGGRSDAVDALAIPSGRARTQWLERI